MKRLIYLLLCCIGPASLLAQATDSLPLKRIYLLRPNQYVGALAKIRIRVNDKVVSLPNNAYMIVECKADSVTLKLENRRLSGESLAPLVTYKPISYFVTIPEEHAHKMDRLILTEVDRDGYDIYAKKVTRQVTPKE